MFDPEPSDGFVPQNATNNAVATAASNAPAPNVKIQLPRIGRLPFARIRAVMTATIGAAAAAPMAYGRIEARSLALISSGCRIAGRQRRTVAGLRTRPAGYRTVWVRATTARRRDGRPHSAPWRVALP